MRDTITVKASDVEKLTRPDLVACIRAAKELAAMCSKLPDGDGFEFEADGFLVRWSGKTKVW